MAIEGGCYCGAVRYEIDGEALFKGQCCCRECQYISGGAPNMVMGVAEPGFRYTKNQPRQFRRSDLEAPVTREFCGECGTHVLARSERMPGALMLKVGTLDDPAVFEGPQMVIYTIDKQPFHQLPDGIPTFERGPA